VRLSDLVEADGLDLGAPITLELVEEKSTSFARLEIQSAILASRFEGASHWQILLGRVDFSRGSIRHFVPDTDFPG